MEAHDLQKAVDELAAHNDRLTEARVRSDSLAGQVLLSISTAQVLLRGSSRVWQQRSWWRRAQMMYCWRAPRIKPIYCHKTAGATPAPIWRVQHPSGTFSALAHYLGGSCVTKP